MNMQKLMQEAQKMRKETKQINASWYKKANTYEKRNNDDGNEYAT